MCCELRRVGLIFQEVQQWIAVLDLQLTATAFLVVVVTNVTGLVDETLFADRVAEGLALLLQLLGLAAFAFFAVILTLCGAEATLFNGAIRVDDTFQQDLFNAFCAGGDCFNLGFVHGHEYTPC